MKKKFPPPSHRPIPTRDKKQKREQTASLKKSRRQEEERVEAGRKRDQILGLRARREGLLPIERSKLDSLYLWGGGFSMPTLEGKYYLDFPFTCVDCGSAQVWTGRQQKWWFEVAGGKMEQIATRCRDCRIRERARKIEARRVHLEGVERKRIARTGLDFLKKRKRKRPIR